MQLTRFKIPSKSVRITFGEKDADSFCRMIGGRQDNPMSILVTNSRRICGEIDGRIVSFESNWDGEVLDTAYMKIKLNRPFQIARYTSDEIEFAGMPFRADKCTEFSVLIDVRAYPQHGRIDIVLSSNREILKMNSWPFECVSEEVYNLVTHMIEVNKQITSNARKAAKK